MAIYIMLWNILQLHLHSQHGYFKKRSTFYVCMAQFCTSIDLLWLIWDVCFVRKTCCDLIRLLKNKGQETPSQHKGWWNKNHHLHIQPLFFSCLWAKLAIRGSVAKVINSIACVVQTHLKKKRWKKMFSSSSHDGSTDTYVANW